MKNINGKLNQLRHVFLKNNNKSITRAPDIDVDKHGDLSDFENGFTHKIKIILFL